MVNLLLGVYLVVNLVVNIVVTGEPSGGPKLVNRAVIIVVVNQLLVCGDTIH